MNSVKQAIVSILLMVTGLSAFFMSLCGGGYSLFLIVQLLFEQSPFFKLGLQMLGWSLFATVVGGIVLLWVRAGSFRGCIEKLHVVVNPKGVQNTKFILCMIGLFAMVAGASYILAFLYLIVVGDFAKVADQVVSMGWVLLVTLLGRLIFKPPFIIDSHNSSD